MSGVRFLASRSLVHGTIDYLTMLLNDDGDVKIGMQESCTTVSKSDHGQADLEAMADIMIQLLKMRSGSEGRVDTSNISRRSSTAKDFHSKVPL